MKGLSTSPVLVRVLAKVAMRNWNGGSIWRQEASSDLLRLAVGKEALLSAPSLLLGQLTLRASEMRFKGEGDCWEGSGEVANGVSGWLCYKCCSQTRRGVERWKLDPVERKREDPGS